MSWGFLGKLRAPNIEVWHIFFGNQSNHIFLSCELCYIQHPMLNILPELPNKAVNLIKRVIFKEIYMTI